MALPGGYLLSNLLCSIVIIFWLCCCTCCGSSKVIADQHFDDNYVIDWGDQQFKFLDAERTQAQIEINQYSGGGFRSKDTYGSGYFQMTLKVPKNTTGIITTFYLTSLKDNEPGGGKHDELDFEFLGRKGGPHYRLQTNIFAQDNGRREQELNLWFDPTSDFHDYGILWNQKQIVFYVDRKPVRVFKNFSQKGVNYPKLPLFIHGSLWNNTQWLGATDWSQGPFYANYRGFGVDGCKEDGKADCGSFRFYWNKWQRLTKKEETAYRSIKRTFLVYDYCRGASGNQFPECGIGN